MGPSEDARGVGRVTINGDRLFADLMELGEIGFVEDRGVTRTALSDADMEGRKWLERGMMEAGLHVRRDAAFNMIGMLKSQAPRDDRVVVIGSHLDTVPQGGRFDGALGVLAGLECVRSIRENGIALPWDLEVINFTDEEAAHNAGTVGSRAMMGNLQEVELHRSRAQGMPTFSQDLKRHGGTPETIHEARRDPSRFVAMLELHIEQGSLLEAQGIPIGVVTGIVGIYRYIVTVRGEASHAGTTPMHLRDDALVKAAPVFTLLPQWVRAQSKEMVGTIGQVDLEPGVSNVVPGTCTFVVELRSMNTLDMVRVRDLLVAWVESIGGGAVEVILEKDSVALSPEIMGIVASAAQSEGLPHIRMASGAGHDAQSFAPYVPTGMIFVPCRRGMSHSPEEWSTPQEVAQGCRVLLRSLLTLSASSRA